MKGFVHVRGGAVVASLVAVLVVVAGEVVVVLVVVGGVVVVHVVVIVVVCLVVLCLVVLLLLRLFAVVGAVAPDTEFRLAMSSSVPWRISWADSGISQIKEEKRLLLEQCEFWRFGRI